jgi:hypothetical protein
LVDFPDDVFYAVHPSVQEDALHGIAKSFFKGGAQGDDAQRCPAYAMEAVIKLVIIP